jgi:hypothetical protein
MSDATPTSDQCLSYRCRVCAAEPGQVCRTRAGREAEYPHMRRTVLVDEGEQQRALRRALRIRALCCECGNLRYVSASYRRQDDNRSADDNLHPQGWRCTTTLKCSACKTAMRHAVLRDDDSDRPEFRDIAETRMHLAPGTGLPPMLYGFLMDERNRPSRRSPIRPSTTSPSSASRWHVTRCGRSFKRSARTT